MPCFDRAVLRDELAQKDSQEGRLSAAVGAQDADFVPAVVVVVTREHGRLAKRVADPLCGDNDIARPLGLLRLEADIAHLRAAATYALLPQFLQCPDTPLVSSAAGLHPLADPDFFLGQFLIEETPFLLGLRLQCRLLAGEERGVITGPVEESRALDFDDSRRQPLQEETVVRDENSGAAFRGAENPPSQ